jgi:hypothetical protein
MNCVSLNFALHKKRMPDLLVGHRNSQNLLASD